MCLWKYTHFEDIPVINGIHYHFIKLYLLHDTLVTVRRTSYHKTVKCLVCDVFVEVHPL